MERAGGGEKKEGSADKIWGGKGDACFISRGATLCLRSAFQVWLLYLIIFSFLHGLTSILNCLSGYQFTASTWIRRVIWLSWLNSIFYVHSLFSGFLCFSWYKIDAWVWFLNLVYVTRVYFLYWSHLFWAHGCHLKWSSILSCVTCSSICLIPIVHPSYCLGYYPCICAAFGRLFGLEFDENRWSYVCDNRCCCGEFRVMAQLEKLWMEEERSMQRHHPSNPPSFHFYYFFHVHGAPCTRPPQSPPMLV